MGVLLVGIVFFNVDLLQMNRDITSMADRAGQLKRENARLRIDLARLASSERIQETALGLGLVYPAPGEVRYLKSQPTVDAKNASKRMSAPDPNYVTPIPTPTTADPSATAPDGTDTADPGATDPTATDPTATDGHDVRPGGSGHRTAGRPRHRTNRLLADRRASRPGDRSPPQPGMRAHR